MGNTISGLPQIDWAKVQLDVRQPSTEHSDFFHTLEGAMDKVQEVQSGADQQVAGVLQDKAGVLRDIGRGGAFVKTEEALPSESDVVLMVSPPGAEVAMPLSARVCWKSHPGSQNGFGVEWKARDAGGSRRIKELVRRIEAQGAHARFV